MFSMRIGERLYLLTNQPDECPHIWIAVKLIPVEFPPGPFQQEIEGKPVHQKTVVACQLHEGEWKWTPLSIPTKGFVADFMQQHDCQIGQWYYLVFAFEPDERRLT